MSAVHGVDLSLTATGIASARIGVTTVKSKGAAEAGLGDRHARLVDLRSRIANVLDEARAKAGDLVVIEAPAFSRTTGHMHDRSGTWWLLVDRLLQLGYAVVEVAPTSRAKYATGRGNAGKDEVLAAVVRRYPDVEVSNNNEADALVLRAMGLDHLGQPLAVMPATHRAALDAVAWPEVA